MEAGFELTSFGARSCTLSLVPQLPFLETGVQPAASVREDAMASERGRAGAVTLGPPVTPIFPLGSKWNLLPRYTGCHLPGHPRPQSQRFCVEAPGFHPPKGCGGVSGLPLLHNSDLQPVQPKSCVMVAEG